MNMKCRHGYPWRHLTRLALVAHVLAVGLFVLAAVAVLVVVLILVIVLILILVVHFKFPPK
jgi:hypothetical protein